MGSAAAASNKKSQGMSDRVLAVDNGSPEFNLYLAHFNTTTDAK